MMGGRGEIPDPCPPHLPRTPWVNYSNLKNISEFIFITISAFRSDCVTEGKAVRVTLDIVIVIVIVILLWKGCTMVIVWG